MLYVPSSNDYRWQISSQGTTRPAAAYGDTITPGNNSKGSWVELFSAAEVTEEVWAILLNFNSGATSAAARDILVDIGIGAAASEVVWINNLIASCASPYNVGSGGVWYFFPIALPAGTRIAVRGSVNNATVGTFRALGYLFGKPARPETTRRGAYVRSFGAVTASSRGTTITLGTTSDGSWTSFGAIADDLWWWQMGFGTNDTTMTAAAIHLDLSAGSAGGEKMLIQDSLVCVTAAEQINNLPLTAGCVANVASGQTIHVRGQSSAAVDTTTSAMVYGVGG